MDAVEDIVASLPEYKKKVLEEFLSNFTKHTTDLKRAIDELRDEIESCDNSYTLLKKKYDTALQEVRLLRKCKQD